MKIPNIQLNNSNKIPQLGFGTWKLKNGDEAYNAVSWALEAGYRHIDTAHIYGNEISVGKAIKESGIKREELFVTTKIFPTQYLNPSKALSGSLEKLGMDYVDLYLVHTPVPGGHKRLWQGLEAQLATNKTRSIGVSNFLNRHLDELLKYAKVVPTVNQVEFHPFLYQQELLEYCQNKDIQIEAYSPLTHAQRLHDDIFNKLAKKYNKSNAQIMIRWSLQLGNIVIPKSAQKERIAENLDVFDFKIDDEDMANLCDLNENLHTCWNPERIP